MVDEPLRLAGSFRNRAHGRPGETLVGERGTRGLKDSALRCVWVSLAGRHAYCSTSSYERYAALPMPIRLIRFSGVQTRGGALP